MATPDRHQRLAAKLRENLRRRKAQAKARDTENKKGDDADETLAETTQESEPSSLATKNVD